MSKRCWKLIDINPKMSKETQMPMQMLPVYWIVLVKRCRCAHNYANSKSSAQICTLIQIIDAVIVDSHHNDIKFCRRFSFDFLSLWFFVVPSVLVTKNVSDLFSICPSN